LNETAAVFLGANHYTGLSGIRTLGRRGVCVIALDYQFSNAFALASRYVHRRVLCPDINIAEQKLVDFLIELAADYSGKPVLIPSHDAYALMIDRHSAALSERYLFHRGPQGLLEQIINKRGLYALSCAHGMRAPLTLLPSGAGEDEDAASKMTFPCLVKPALSHLFVKVFRRKLFVAHDKNELFDALRRSREANLEVMVQQLIPGFDDKMYLLSVFIDREGQATHVVSAQKLRQFPANFGSSTLTHQYPVPKLFAPGISFLQRIGYRGYCELEFKRHADTDEFYMLEVNARLSTLNSLYDACGLEYPYIIYRDLTGDPLPPVYLTDKHLNYAFYHFYEDIYSVDRYLKTKQLAWKNIIMPLLVHRKIYAVWALDDPVPVLHFVKIIIQKLWRRFISRIKRPGPLKADRRLRNDPDSSERGSEKR